jgi:hypothetical protein
MKVYIIMQSNWNGEYSVESVFKIIKTDDVKKIQKIVDDFNSKRGSSYSTEFVFNEYEEFEVEEI